MWREYTERTLCCTWQAAARPRSLNSVRTNVQQTRVVRILRQKIAKFACVSCKFCTPYFCEFCALFQANFSTLNYQWHSYTTLFTTLVHVLSRSCVLCALLCFFITLWCCILYADSSINHCLFWRQLTTEATERVKFVTIWNCDQCNCSINAQNGEIFY